MYEIETGAYPTSVDELVKKDSSGKAYFLYIFCIS